MKKKDIIKQKNKLKQTGNYKYLRYAKFICILIVVLFLCYVAVLGNITKTSYETLLSENAIVITGFMICGANLYIWYVLKHFLEDLQIPQNVESIRLNLILVAIGQFILMNFISAILIVLSLRKYFQWNQFSFKTTWKDIKKDKQSAVFYVTSIVLLLFIALVYGVYFSIR